MSSNKPETPRLIIYPGQGFIPLTEKKKDKEQVQQEFSHSRQDKTQLSSQQLPKKSS